MTRLVKRKLADYTTVYRWKRVTETDKQTVLFSTTMVRGSATGKESASDITIRGFPHVYRNPWSPNCYPCKCTVFLGVIKLMFVAFMFILMSRKLSNHIKGKVSHDVKEWVVVCKRKCYLVPIDEGHLLIKVKPGGMRWCWEGIKRKKERRMGKQAKVTLMSAGAGVWNTFDFFRNFSISNSKFV